MTPAARPRAGKARPSDPLGIMYEPPSDPPAKPLLDDLELPLPSAPAASDGLDFELDLPTPRKGSEDDTQKTKRSTLDSYGDLDLPTAKSPAPKAPSDPAPSFGEVDLPTPKVADLFGGLDLPLPDVSQSLDDLDLPLPRAESIDLPVSKTSLDLPAPKRMGVPKISGGLPPVLADAPEPTLDLPKPRALPQPPPEAARGEKAGAGSATFGELDLGGDDMEFGDIPQVAVTSSPPQAQPPRLSIDHDAIRDTGNVPDIAVTADAPVVPGRVQGGRSDKGPARPAKKKGKGVLVAAVFLAVVVAAGVGVGFATNYGFFGMYAFEQLTSAAGSPEIAQREIAAAEQRAASDTYEDVKASLASLGSARHRTGLNFTLLARSVAHEGLYQARFGTDSTSSVRISQIMARIEERGGEAPGIELARAADALARGAIPEAANWARQAHQRNANDPYVGLISGEIALRGNHLEEAQSAFENAAAHQGGARARWGLARALVAQGAAGALAAVSETLSASPNHVGARIAKAKLILESGETAQAVVLLQQVLALRASISEKAEAYAVLGHVYEKMDRTGDAHQAYTAALALASSRIDVLLGDGRVLLLQHQYADALARFETVLSDASSANEHDGARTALASANLGAARALLELDRARDARAKLVELAAASPEDIEVLIALGRAEQILGNNAEAELKLREAIRLAPQSFEAYLVLSNLFIGAGNPAAAGEILAQAMQHVDETAEVRRQLGESEMVRGNLVAAIEQFTQAQRLDANNTGSIFGMGVALRRSGRLDEAQAQYERLVTLDAQYPGLEVERGLLFEARGESERAVASFSAALRARPNDLDLLLRLGAAQVGAGQLDGAEVSLRRVQQDMPNSAELEHFVGRLAFARHELREATAHFERAVTLDGTRAEYHLYLGWAALESGAFGKALEQVEAALARDPSMGDAFWIRGEVRLRSGAVRDALDDLIHATALKPARFEAFSAIAECYDQLRRRPEAIGALRRALEGDESRGDWWYRLGRLYFDDGNRTSAEEALNHALAIGDAANPAPAWLADAHRWLAESLRLAGNRAEAIVHYNRYLALASPSAIDRADVTRILGEMSR